MGENITLRLDRWLASQGLGSRKEVSQLIRQGRVQVNKTVENSPNRKLTQEDHVVVDGKPVILERYVYYMMNKPAGTLSATRDKRGATVLDLLPKEMKRPGLFPAGRLDKDTEGFLLITNDGEFAHRVLAPKNKVPKTYLVHLDQPFPQEELVREFHSGVTIGQGENTSGAQLKVLDGGAQPVVELTIYEGMFHQVKRMFGLFGLEVIYLKRLTIGGLKLDSALELGQTKQITMQEAFSILEQPE